MKIFEERGVSPYSWGISPLKETLRLPPLREWSSHFLRRWLWGPSIKKVPTLLEEVVVGLIC